VKGHLEQLGEWFQANGQLLEDTLSAVQAGIVGYWGEGHSNVNFEKKYTGRAFDLLCVLFPKTFSCRCVPLTCWTGSPADLKPASGCTMTTSSASETAAGAFSLAGQAKEKLGSMRAATYTVDLPEGFDSAQPHSIGIKLAHCAGSTICARFVNDTAFVDGAQMIIG